MAKHPRINQRSSRWPLLALCGAATIARRWLWWALTVVAVFAAAVALTKPAVRELFLVYPAVYLLAAQGAERLASWISAWSAAWLGGRPAGQATPTEVAPRRAVVAALLVLLALGVTNADLIGNYDLPIRWYRVQ